jgi:hypothetical protein
MYSSVRLKILPLGLDSIHSIAASYGVIVSNLNSEQLRCFKDPRTLEVGIDGGAFPVCESFSFQDATSMRDESDSATMARLLPAAFERPLGISHPSGPEPVCELSHTSHELRGHNRVHLRVALPA